MSEITWTPALDAQQAIFYCPASYPVVGNRAEHFRKQANDTYKHKPIPIAPSFTVYPEVLKTRIPIYFNGLSSEIDFLDNLPIEERNQPLLDTKCIFQVCLNDENVI